MVNTCPSWEQNIIDARNVDDLRYSQGRDIPNPKL